MSDHEFEKQVQRKMDEFKLRPSAAVWAEVEKNIRPTKRRRFIFWLPVLFITLATSGVVLYQYNQPAAPLAKATTLTSTKEASTTQPGSETSGVSANTTTPNAASQSNANSSSDQKINSEEKSTSAASGMEESSIVKRETSNVKRETEKAIGPSVTINDPVKTNASAIGNRQSAKQSKATVNDKVIAYNKVTGNNNRKSNNTTTANKQTTVNNTAPEQNIVAGSSHHKPIASKQQPNRSTKKKHLTTDQEDLVTTENTSFPTSNTKTSITSTNQPEEQAFIATPQLTDLDNTIATSQAVNEPLSLQTEKIFAPEKQNTITAQPTPPIERTRGPKWQWGAQANFGYSRISQSSLFELNGLLGSENKNKAEDLAQSSVAPPGTQVSNSYNPGRTTEKTAAPIQVDLSYSAGVYVQRPLSKRLRLTIGLQYAYMSAHTTVGKLVEQTAMVNQGASQGAIVDRYYTSQSFRDPSQPQLNFNNLNAPFAVPPVVSQKFTYRFHAVELPVAINWQINKGRQLPPFVLDAGFSILQLVKFDALHYDGVKNIYYKEDGLVNKTQLNAILGLNVGLFQRSKLPVWIGPSLRYSLTGLVKKEISNGQFLWSTGLNVRVNLGRL